MTTKENDREQARDYGNFESNLNFLNQSGVVSKEKVLLEIGSGTGRMLSFFHTKGYDIKGVEKAEERIERSRKFFGNLPISKVTSEKLPFENHSFDIVMSFDVFEHIPNSNGHLSEVNRVLKTNGYYLLQTPNKLTNVVFETIRWRSFTKWREDHCSLHSYWEIIERFKHHGFEVQFYDIPVVDEFFKSKVKKHLGNFGLSLVKIINPDKLPQTLKTNFYIKSKKVT